MLRKLHVDKNLHILVVEDKEENVFLAHCLDLDIVGQGRTAKEAVLELTELVETQLEYCLENDMLDTAFRPAPKESWDMFYRAQAAKIINQISLRRKNFIKNLVFHIELAYA